MRPARLLTRDVALFRASFSFVMFSYSIMIFFFFFFFQAEDGIRDHCVTGVQTCALPISEHLFPKNLTRTRIERAETPIHISVKNQISRRCQHSALARSILLVIPDNLEIGRASCRERV